jgi:hypothetical protein
MDQPSPRHQQCPRCNLWKLHFDFTDVTRDGRRVCAECVGPDVAKAVEKAAEVAVQRLLAQILDANPEE